MTVNMDLDQVLVPFKIHGRYHLLAMVLLILNNVCTEMASLNYIFAAEEVKYNCKGFENATCSSFNSNNTCPEWIYEVPNSFVAEFGLACQEWKRTLIGTIHSLGYMVGLILVGPLSDRLGRKKAVIITSIASGVMGVSKSFANGYWMYIVLEFLEASLGDSFSPIFMLVVEIVSTEKRVNFITLNAMGYPTGAVLLAVIAWLFPYWRSYIRMIYAPAFLFIFYQFILDESPRWLLANGRKDEAVAIIKKAAKMNKMKIDEDSLEKLEYQKEDSLDFVECLKSTFKSKSLLKRFFVCVVWWTTSTFVSYGMTINAVSLQGNKYLNFGIIFLIEIPGILLNMVFLKYMKRKYALMTYFFIGAILCIVQPFVPLNLSWLSTTLYMVGKLMTMFYFDTTYLYTSELFPTYTRNSMHALCSAIGRIGSIIAPQTPLLMVYWPGLPALVFGGVSLFACLVTMLVPDTAHDALPDTIKQAEAIGHKNNGVQGVKNPSFISDDSVEMGVTHRNTNTSL